MKCLDEYGRFDKTLWKPQYYDTIEGINNALKENGIFEKTIRCVHVIGLCLEENGIDYPWELGLHDYDIPLEERIARKQSWLEKNRKECSVLTCEPVVIVFTDDSTLEFMPSNIAGNVDGMLLSFNQISPEVVDGTNISDIDSETLFQHVAGLKLNQIIRFKESLNRQNLKEDCNINTNVWTCFLSKEDGGVFVNYRGWSNFVFGITTNQSESQRCFVSYVKTAFYNSAITDRQKQVKITEGNDRGDAFVVFPTKRIEVPNGGNTREMIGNIARPSNKHISMDLDKARELLFYFLCDYFDSNYPYNEIPSACKWGDEPPFDFDEYTSNLYTYQTIYKMLDDIENCCKLLEFDYDNPELDGLKRWFSSWTFRTDNDIMCAKDEEKAMIKNNIHIAIDFYRSFIRRMKIMLRDAPEYDLICFEGP